MATPSNVIPFISQNRYLSGKQLNGYGLLMWLIAGTVQPAAETGRPCPGTSRHPPGHRIRRPLIFRAILRHSSIDAEILIKWNILAMPGQSHWSTKTDVRTYL